MENRFIAVVGHDMVVVSQLCSSVALAVTQLTFVYPGIIIVMDLLENNSLYKYSNMLLSKGIIR